MSDTATQFETLPDRRWQVVLDRRETLADKIEQAAKAQSVTLRGRARQVSTFLRRDGSFESAIVRPDVIAFTHPLLSSDECQSLSDEQLAWAASNGLSSLNCQPSTLQRLSQLMIYPALIAVACFGLYLGFAFYIAPEFEQMFEEFGMELPVVTSRLFDLASAVRAIGWLIGALLIAFLLVAILWLRVPGAIISRFKFLEKAVRNKRQAMAEVAFHAAQLRNMGLSAEQASAAAMSSAGLPAASHDPSTDTPGSKADGLFDSPNGSQMSGYSLLEFAMRQPANHENNRMLLEVADCYRRRIVTMSDWWIQWLVYGFQWLVIACVVFVVFSMFMPLFSIVSGLTG